MSLLKNTQYLPIATSVFPSMALYPCDLIVLRLLMVCAVWRGSEFSTSAHTIPPSLTQVCLVFLLLLLYSHYHYHNLGFIAQSFPSSLQPCSLRIVVGGKEKKGGRERKRLIFTPVMGWS